jgi:hypothetical protein
MLPEATSIGAAQVGGLAWIGIVAAGFTVVGDDPVTARTRPSGWPQNQPRPPAEPSAPAAEVVPLEIFALSTATSGRMVEITGAAPTAEVTVRVGETVRVVPVEEGLWSVRVRAVQQVPVVATAGAEQATATLRVRAHLAVSMRRAGGRLHLRGAVLPAGVHRVEGVVLPRRGRSRKIVLRTRADGTFRKSLGRAPRGARVVLRVAARPGVFLGASARP